MRKRLIYKEELIEGVKKLYGDNSFHHKLAKSGNYHLGVMLNDDTDGMDDVNYESIYLGKEGAKREMERLNTVKDKFQLYCMWVECVEEEMDKEEPNNDRIRREKGDEGFKVQN